MGDLLRTKLRAMIASQFDDFLKIKTTMHNAQGKLSTINCELVMIGQPYRVVISCSQETTFLVYLDDEVAVTKPSEGHIESPHFVSEWIEAVNEFGMSGKCRSLTALTQFAYNIWKQSHQTHRKQSTASFEERINSSGACSSSCALPDRQMTHRELLRVLEEGDAASAMGNLQHAIEIYSEALNVPPASCDQGLMLDLLASRCVAYTKVNMWNLALRDADCLTRLNPTGAAGYWHRGIALQGLGKKHEALDALMTALEYDPENFELQLFFTKLFDEITNQQASNSEPTASSSGCPLPDAGRWCEADVASMTTQRTGSDTTASTPSTSGRSSPQTSLGEGMPSSPSLSRHFPELDDGCGTGFREELVENREPTVKRTKTESADSLEDDLMDAV